MSRRQKVPKCVPVLDIADDELGHPDSLYSDKKPTRLESDGPSINDWTLACLMKRPQVVSPKVRTA